MKSRLFAGQISNSQGFSYGFSYSPNHSKNRTIQNLNIFSGFLMVFDKMAPIYPDFKWLGFRSHSKSRLVISAKITYITYFQSKFLIFLWLGRIKLKNLKFLSMENINNSSSNNNIINNNKERSSSKIQNSFLLLCQVNDFRWMCFLVYVICENKTFFR